MSTNKFDLNFDMTFKRHLKTHLFKLSPPVLHQAPLYVRT